MTDQRKLHSSEPEGISANGSTHDISVIPLELEKAEKKVPLAGKVALIMGGATEQGQSLALGFADRNVDVVLIYFNEDHARAIQIKEQVEKRGRQCMLVVGPPPDDEMDALFAQDVMLQLLQRFGRLDIFINLSTRSFPLGDLLQEDDIPLETFRTRLFPHFNMMKAAINQLTVD